MSSKDIIINILIKRDHISYNEAENLFEQVAEEIYEVIESGDIQYCEDIIASELGLEPDYLIYFLENF